MLCQRKYLMLPLSLQDRNAGDCGWHCPAEPLVIDTTKTGSKSFCKGAWSKHSNVEHKRLCLRAKRKAEHKPTPPEHSVTISTLHTGKDLWGFPPQEMLLLHKDKAPPAHWMQGQIHMRFFGLRGVGVICIFNFSSFVREQAETQTAAFGLNISYSWQAGCPAATWLHLPCQGDFFTTSSEQQGQNSATAHRYQETSFSL